ncbi:MAG: VIT1/CCC1 transporter family protein [bacterium]|nr:VIT1/CCC1 transporter family protein [bacterium]
MLKRIENNLREFVYGGMDGAVTTFAVVTGAAGANLSVRIILILGFANVLADGFSMAVGSFLSEKSEQDLSVHKGESNRDDHESPIKASVATFVSFLFVGFIPLSIYTIDFIFKLGLDAGDMLVYSVFLTLFAFALIGLLRARITKITKSKAVIESLGLGLAAAIISFVVGNLLEKVIR